MSRPNFRFKQFEVWHDKCAMKVGTDGVLLGAWCPIGEFRSLGVQELGEFRSLGVRRVQEFRSTSEQAQSASEPLPPIKVLDIGTGSGLIALMLAQRLSSLYTLHPMPYTIHAIDIDAGAVEQSLFNFAQSPWAKHLQIFSSSLQSWYFPIADNPTDSVAYYDLIVSNPPYFQASLKNPDQARATARHTDSLSYSELIQHAARLLSERGVLALILPAEAEPEIIALAKEQDLYPIRITYVHSKPGKEAKRILIAFSHCGSPENTRSILGNSDRLAPSHLHIESASSPRSEEYQELTKEFYL